MLKLKRYVVYFLFPFFTHSYSLFFFVLLRHEHFNTGRIALTAFLCVSLVQRRQRRRRRAGVLFAARIQFAFDTFSFRDSRCRARHLILSHSAFFDAFLLSRSDSFRFGMGYALVPSVQRKHTIRFFRRCSVNLLAIYKFKLKSIRKTGFQSRAPHRMLHFAIWLVFFSVRFVSAWSQSQVEREGYEKITKEREILKHLVRFFTAMQKNYEKMQ